MSDLHNALQAYGLVVTSLIMDGNIHRCGTAAKPRSTNGWYVVYEEGIAASFGDWANGDEAQYWNNGKLTEHDHEKVRERIQSLREQREQERLEKADQAVNFFESCAREGFSDYLVRKQVAAHGIRFDGTTIIIPMQDSEGKIWSYQKIYADGSKWFFQGGRVQGCYHVITERHIQQDEQIIVCEGYSTGAAIYEATGIPVFVAFNAGNLKAVCDSLVFRNILIAADNDKPDTKLKQHYPLGVGESCAKQSGYPYIISSHEGWDFNDVLTNGNLGDVKSYFVKEADSVPIGNIQVHGLVGQIADWITSTAIRPQPILSLAAALAFVGMLKGHRIHGYTDLRTNLLVMALAPTAAGKEHPQNCVKRLATVCGLDSHMMGEPVSGGGFLTGLNKANRVGLLVMDEIGRYIGNLSGKMAGTHQREIIDYIIKTFSCANSMLKGRQYVDEKKNPSIDIKQPHFCCLGATVPERMQAACGSAEIIDGFLNRWLVFSVTERVQRQQKVRFSQPPQELVDAISKLSLSPTYSAYGDPEPLEVRFTVEAWAFFTEYRDKVDGLIERAKYPADRLYSRTCEHIEKVALTLSDNVWIHIQDVQAAIQIVEQSNTAIMQFVGLIADNVYEQDFIRVREIIREAGEIKRSLLTMRAQFVSGGARRIGEIVETLVEANLVAVRKSGKAAHYKWIG